MAEALEHTLFIAREVSLYRIPPSGSGGHKSGEWKTADKIFTGRLRCVARGELCEVRLEDPASGELFAVCPVPPGQRPQAVEPATDSSRYFVLRVVDSASGRHAFLGLGFGDRTEAFDFNVALSDHEKHLQRDKEVSAAKRAAAEGPPGGDAAAAAAGPQGAENSEAAALYRPAPGALREGETIKINMKKAPGGPVTGGAGGAGFLSQLGHPDKLVPLAPPPSGTSPPVELMGPAASQASRQPVSLPSSSAPGVDLLGLENPEPQPQAAALATGRAGSGRAPPPQQQAQQAQQQQQNPPGAGAGGGGTANWATF